MNIIAEVMTSFLMIQNLLRILSIRLFSIGIILSLLICITFVLRKFVKDNVFVKNICWLIPTVSVFAFNFYNNENVVNLLYHTYYIYWLGVVIFAVVSKIKNRRFIKIAKSAKAISLPQLEKRRQRVDVRQSVSVRQIRFDCPPFTYGMIKPTIYLSAKNSYSDHELEMILIHELTHIKQHDLLFRRLFSIINALFWYNPIVYIAFDKFCTDREMLCDAESINTGAIGKLEYGGLILREASPDLAHLFAFFSSSNGLSSRIKGIVSYSPQTKAKKRIAACLVSISIIVTGCFLATASISAYETEETASFIRVEDGIYYTKTGDLPPDYFNLQINDFVGFNIIDGDLHLKSDVLLSIKNYIDPADEREYELIYTPFYRQGAQSKTYRYIFTYADLLKIKGDVVVIENEASELSVVNNLLYRINTFI